MHYDTCLKYKIRQYFLNPCIAAWFSELKGLKYINKGQGQYMDIRLALLHSMATETHTIDFVEFQSSYYETQAYET